MVTDESVNPRTDSRKPEQPTATGSSANCVGADAPPPNPIAIGPTEGTAVNGHCGTAPPVEMLAAAESYARLGWHVIPTFEATGGACTCGKGANCPSPGKHPRIREWQHEATTDHNVICGWFSAWPNMNIGVATGPRSRVLVVDVDPRNGGDETFAELERRYGSLPETPTVRSGAGGRHFYLEYPHGLTIKSAPHALGKGVDVKADCGQVIAPPSMHASGGQYTWNEGKSPADVPVAQCPPSWLAALSREAQPTTNANTKAGSGSPNTPAQPPQLPTSVPGSSSFSPDKDLLYAAKTAANGGKFKALFDGQNLDYPSASEGDMALAAMLAFWSCRDIAQMDRLFRQSARMRPKWDTPHAGNGQTYGAMTLNKAAAGCTETYSSQKRGGHTSRGASGSGNPVASGDIPLTDCGNALRLVQRFGCDLRYCFPWNKWLIWDGTRWKIDDTGRINAWAKEAIKELYISAISISDVKLARTTADFALASQSSRALDAMIKLARDEVPVLPDELDTDRYLLNVNNGTVELRTGRLRDHRREDLITKIAPVAYDHTTVAPQFELFIQQIMASDKLLIEFLQRLLGMCLTGDITEHILPIFHGCGANGKSTLLDTISDILGDYACIAAPDLLMVKQHSDHPTEIADLQGRRLVIASETEEGKWLKLQLVKRLTGDATLKGRRMREDFFEFPRTHKTILVTNNLPVIRESKEAAWRRLRLVPFSVVIPEPQQDKELPEKLRAEAPGILAWLMHGCIAWQQGGLQPPPSVANATQEYRDEQDVLAPFIDARCVIGPTEVVARSRIYVVYQEWASSNHEFRPLDRVSLYDRLRTRGHAECWVTTPKKERAFSGIGTR
jgi:putative DNA primase/helicase